jgi:uncharacterized repeat protein (TIGR01451 family)
VATGGEVNLENNWAIHTVTAYGQPRLSLTKTAVADSVSEFGTFLTYSIIFTNLGTAAAVAIVVVDSLPPQVDFMIGSASALLPPGVTAVVEYSRNGSTWDYSPVHGGCGAPPGMDACVTQIRWRLSDPFPHAEPNSGTARLSARIR